MSGLSKALRCAVLVAAISGCSVNPSQRTSASDGTAAAAQDTAFYAEGQQDTGGVYPSGVADQSIGDQALPADTTVAGVTAGQELPLGSGPFTLSLTQSAGATRFVIVSEGTSPKYSVKTQESPGKVIVDVLDRPSHITKSLPIQNDPFVRTVRVGGHPDRTRFVFDLASGAASATEHHVDQSESGIAIVFGSETAAAVTQPMASAGDTGALAAASVPAETSSVETYPAEQAQPTGQIVIETVDLTDLRFIKTAHSPNGEVTLVLSGQVPFYLKRSTPTEYVLTLAGTQPTESTLTPLVSPPNVEGIRSARAVQEGENTVVRMFVDVGTELSARPAGNNVIIAASRTGEGRAQLQPEPPPAGGDAAAAGDAGKSPTGAPPGLISGGGDDETARRNPTGVPSADGSKTYTGRLISLDLQETDIDNALRIIAEVSNLNIIASDDVAGKVTLRLIDVPWDQALDVILKTNGLDQVTEGNVIRIAPVDKLRQEREALKEAKKAAENLEDLKVKYIRISYARAVDLKDQVESVLSERGTVAVDERTNQLIVKDIAKGHDEVIQLIKRLDLRTPQVLLETQIIEAQASLLRDLGFQWNFNYVQSPQTGNPTGLVFPNSVDIGGTFTAPAQNPGNVISAVLDSADGSRALTARLSYLEQEGRVKIISRPQVATVNNKQAEIRSVETLRVRLPDSGLSVATGQGATAAGAGGSAFEEIEVGITLRVTPQASPDYYVLLDVDAKSSTLGAQVVDNIPSTVDRQATSTVLIKSGQTFALGGVYRIEDRNTVDGVPFLKDVPFIGHVFRHTLVDNGDEELIFFITPHIVEGSFDPSLM